MSFDWAEYINVARELMGVETTPSGSEARLRVAISRLYYAALHKSRHYMAEVFNVRWNRQDRESHLFVIEWFERFPDETYRQVGQKLRRLREKRRRADYEDQYTELQRESLHALRLALDILRLLETLIQ